MGKLDKILEKLLRGGSDSNISFREMCSLLTSLGFHETIRGSHHVFRKEGIAEKINLQRDGNESKGYQVRQVREILIKYRIDTIKKES